MVAGFPTSQLDRCKLLLEAATHSSSFLSPHRLAFLPASTFVFSQNKRLHLAKSKYMRLQALLAPLDNSGGPRTVLGTAAVLALALASADALTVYDQIPLAQMTITQSGVSATQAAQPTLAAYDTVKLRPPPIPNPAPQVAFGIPLERNAQNVPSLSIQHKGPSFWGFSIEMSVITQVCE